MKMITGAALAALLVLPGAAMGQGMGGGMMGAGHGMMGSNAQGYGNMGNGMMGGMMPMMGWDKNGASMCEMMAGHMESRLTYLKSELKITKEQEALWKAYASAARSNAQTMLGRCTAMMESNGMQNLSLPQRLDLHEQFMAAQLESMRAMDKAMKPLYASFGKAQKDYADRLFWGPMGMMQGGMGGSMGMQGNMGRQ